MNRLPILAMTSLLCLLGATQSPARAQFYPNPRLGYNQYNRAPISPYLNLLRGGNPAANYYLGVRPEFTQRAFNNQFGTSLQELEKREAAGTPEDSNNIEAFPTLPGTGHPTAFNNVGNYFNSGSPGIRPQGGGQAKPAPNRRRTR